MFTLKLLQACFMYAFSCKRGISRTSGHRLINSVDSHLGVVVFRRCVSALQQQCATAVVAPYTGMNEQQMMQTLATTDLRQTCE